MVSYMFITPGVITELERYEKIFNTYIKNDYNKFTENNILNYFTLLKYKDELNASVIIINKLNMIKEKIDIYRSSNKDLSIIKDFKTNDDFYDENNVLNKKEIEKIVAYGKNDNILYAIYGFNTSYYVKKILYNNIPNDRNLDYSSNLTPTPSLISRHVIFRFNNYIMIQNLNYVDQESILNLVKGNINFSQSSYIFAYDEKKPYDDISYLFQNRYEINVLRRNRFNNFMNNYNDLIGNDIINV